MKINNRITENAVNVDNFNIIHYRFLLNIFEY